MDCWLLKVDSGHNNYIILYNILIDCNESIPEELLKKSFFKSYCIDKNDNFDAATRFKIIRHKLYPHLFSKIVCR